MLYSVIDNNLSQNQTVSTHVRNKKSSVTYSFSMAALYCMAEMKQNLMSFANSYPVQMTQNHIK